MFAKITELIYLLVHILRPQKLRLSFIESVIAFNFALFHRVDQVKIFAVFVALVSRKELQNSFIAKITRIEPILVQAVNQRICEHVSDSLNINNQKIASGKLPGEMTQGLSDL